MKTTYETIKSKDGRFILKKDNEIYMVCDDAVVLKEQIKILKRLEKNKKKGN